MERILRTNLFVQAQDNQRIWYRYHQIFADLLRHRLRERYPDQRAALHRRASQWFADNDHHEEAIEHAFAAEDYERVAQLIEPVAHSLFSRGKMMTLHRWLSALPVEQIRSHPQLYLLEGWLLYRLGQFSALDAFVQRSPTLAEHFVQAHETPAWMVERMRRLISASPLPFAAVKGSGPALYKQLTQREVDVLRLIGDGLTTPQIAEALIVGVSTVRTYIKSIYAKFDVHSRHEAVVRARELDLL